ncbi:RING/FYVE/PHD zinc finger superfamily protein [Striga asiatica]|uniref:RING/FYVE/PHD zinc finger superfamily protein n=1 Tax=Striga asiatica TaxID=4170 RepID=A0A5A7PJL8_STRAF|nr:RING/FYVE/PHD zinc finger superfamily protein [Striga asiatica]
MGDHFVLLVDRLLTESTLRATIESGNLLNDHYDETIIDCSVQDNYEASCLSPRKLVECRICQDEDFNSNMEAPCSCSGSLKYAHRKCVQRWCNEKGDTICEICHQQFKPGYIAPPPIFRFGGLPMNIRGNWQISARDLNNPRIIAMVSTNHSLLDDDYDEYEFSTSRRIICCCAVAIIANELTSVPDEEDGQMTLHQPRVITVH